MASPSAPEITEITDDDMITHVLFVYPGDPPSDRATRMLARTSYRDCTAIVDIRTLDDPAGVIDGCPALVTKASNDIAYGTAVFSSIKTACPMDDPVTGLEWN